MKRIVVNFEGGDAAGKGTQTKLLHDRFKSIGREVTVFDFPQYNTFTGAFVKECLLGKHGDFLAMNPRVASVVYVLDRVAARKKMEHAIRCDDVVIFNRFTASNLALQGAKLEQPERQEFISFIETLEYDILGIPRHDLILYLEVSVDITKKLLLERGEELDAHEKDLRHQQRAAETYRELAENNPDTWAIISCVEEGSLISREKVHEKVWAVVKERFGL